MLIPQHVSASYCVALPWHHGIYNDRDELIYNCYDVVQAYTRNIIVCTLYILVYIYISYTCNIMIHDPPYAFNEFNDYG